MKKVIKKAILKAFNEGQKQMFKKLSFFYMEEIEYKSDYARALLMLTWFMFDFDDEDLKRIKANRMDCTKSMHKDLMKEIKGCDNPQDAGKKIISYLQSNHLK